MPYWLSAAARVVRRKAVNALVNVVIDLPTQVITVFNKPGNDRTAVHLMQAGIEIRRPISAPPTQAVRIALGIVGDRHREIAFVVIDGHVLGHFRQLPHGLAGFEHVVRKSGAHRKI